jgi:hypothetical protein
MPYDFSSLDQETLKANIIAYIKEDATFADYNFDGSALNSIANLLTYVTLQQNFYLNMTTQELYLDTATLFRNAAAIAKSLNYVPFRMTPAKLTTDAQFVDSTALTEIPQHCKFLVDGIPFTTRTAFNFTNDEIVNIELHQMEIVTETYNFNSVPYELLNGTNIADDYVIVKVNGELWTEYNPADVINYESKVYFLSFNNNDKLTVTFGDGIYGQTPILGYEIEVIYGTTIGIDGNGLEEIVLDQVVSEFDIAFTNSIISYNGTAAETLNSIKLNAPKFYEAQNRIVTKSDYKVFIEGHSPSDVNLVNVWNGAESTPPIYGTVFITVKPNSSLNLTAQQKEDLLAYLAEFTVMSIRTQIVDATYIYVNIASTVYYYKSYGVSTTELRATIEQNVQDYFDNELSSFNTKLRYSNLVHAIDLPNEVSNNLSELTYNLKFGQAPNHQYNFDVQNAITEGSVVNTYVYDEGGIIKLVAGDTAVGTINYSTGVISFATTMDATDNLFYFKTDSDDFVFESSNLPYYSDIAITFEGI